MENPISQDKKKVLKPIETILKDILTQIPGITESEKQNVDKVVESFIEYCGKTYSTQYIRDNMHPAQKATALFYKYMLLQTKKRKAR